MRKPSVSILIPAYNDVQTIADVVAEADRVGKKVASKYEIVVVNDASADDTGVVLQRLKGEYRRLRVKTHGANLGYGGTIRELYYEAKMEWLYTVPGDWQIPVAEVSKLLPYRDRADMVIGRRVDRHDPPARLRQSRFYNSLLRKLFSLGLHDINSVRLMRRSVLDTVILTTSSAFVDAELAIRAVRAGFRVIEVPILHKKRESDGAGGGKLSTILPVILDTMRFKLQLV